MDNTQAIPLSQAQVRFTTLRYKNFIVRYCLRYDRGDLVYQFFMDEPEAIERSEMEGSVFDHRPFKPRFKELLEEVLSGKVKDPAKLDIAYVRLYNSFSVIARGYAASLGLKFLLEPLFEDLDRRINDAYPAPPARTKASASSKAK